MKEKQIRVRLPLIVYVDGLIFYDAQNQLLSETIGSDTTSYTYDTAGNIRSVTGPSVSKSFSYNDSGDWKDLLTSVTVNGTTRSITYEEENGRHHWQSAVPLQRHAIYPGVAKRPPACQPVRRRKIRDLHLWRRRHPHEKSCDRCQRHNDLPVHDAKRSDRPPVVDGRQRALPDGLSVRRHRAARWRCTTAPKTASQTDFNGDSYYYETNQQGDVTGLYKITYNATTKALSATRVASYRARRLGQRDLLHRRNGRYQPLAISRLLPRLGVRVLLSAEQVL